MTEKPVCPSCKGTGRVRAWTRTRRCHCTPKPAKVFTARTATHTGECGVCERAFTVDPKTNVLALHGFERPGHGYIVGKCPGRGMLPVELSTATIELVRDIAKASAEDHEAAIERWSERSESVLSVFFERKKKGYHLLNRKSASYHDLFELIEIKRGDPAGFDHDDRRPSFDELLATKLKAAEFAAKVARETEARAERRLTEWAPKPLTPVPA